MPDSDLQRMRLEYQRRQTSESTQGIYTVFNPAFFFFRVQRQRQILKLLESYGISSLKRLKILEIGCGSGSVLHEFISLGAKPGNVFGIDLIHYRLASAREKLPQTPFACTDGRFLPFPDASFDMVMQFTALSSILDATIRKDVAKEMLRVLAPKGFILWYDFFLNPTNAQTCGIGKKEIVDIFPHCAFDFHRTTLAPPLARRIAPISWPMATMIEATTLFNSHYLVGIQRDSGPGSH